MRARGDSRRGEFPHRCDRGPVGCCPGPHPRPATGSSRPRRVLVTSQSLPTFDAPPAVGRRSAGTFESTVPYRGPRLGVRRRSTAARGSIPRRSREPCARGDGPGFPRIDRGRHRGSGDALRREGGGWISPPLRPETDQSGPCTHCQNPEICAPWADPVTLPAHRVDPIPGGVAGMWGDGPLASARGAGEVSAAGSKAAIFPEAADRSPKVSINPVLSSPEGVRRAIAAWRPRRGLGKPIYGELWRAMARMAAFGRRTNPVGRDPLARGHRREGILPPIAGRGGLSSSPRRRALGRTRPARPDPRAGEGRRNPSEGRHRPPKGVIDPFRPFDFRQEIKQSNEGTVASGYRSG